MNPNEPLPTCAVCLGIDPHTMPVVECLTDKTWDSKHETFSKQSNCTLISKATGQCICTHWQWCNSCSERHSHVHICSGCGSASHGAHCCPRAQKCPSSNSI
ncbi:hypothetical protein PAXRUDRAFT_132850 [Paxillus rubicundulus Ve08.2h10]|uniref:Unplaced genomic scaffold scaffold_49, whole genome shotgun sequence n=1 Tax=Paxillus rubicundulus Ve08.2h10 TaxID=930991 RepID=A0A0D0E923_9AGAM|nr:hypothetical protein PAXRUDRAFT_132850 [Paxillus rubicundulus Ve08.2h10]